MEFQQVTIVGCGLIGGSFALALRRAGFQGRITACGGTRSPALAVERGVADAVEESFGRGELCGADLVYLAAPIGGILDFLKTRGAQLKPGAMVTDAGSTKVEIVRTARNFLPVTVQFIGGHPMAGSQYTGVEYARADLFDNATYALIAGKVSEAKAFNAFKALIDSLGARVLVTDAESHDAAVALISHLPQLAASVLATLLGPEMDGQVAERALAQRLAATGWQDMTRLAGSSWSVWRDICITNQPNLSTALGHLIAELQSLKEALDARDFNRARELFAAANTSVEQHRASYLSRFEKLREPAIDSLATPPQTSE